VPARRGRGARRQGERANTEPLSCLSSAGARTATSRAHIRRPPSCVIGAPSVAVARIGALGEGAKHLPAARRCASNRVQAFLVFVGVPQPDGRNQLCAAQRSAGQGRREGFGAEKASIFFSVSSLSFLARVGGSLHLRGLVLPDGSCGRRRRARRHRPPPGLLAARRRRLVVPGRYVRHARASRS
jgi:hypothetical protein